MIDNHKMGSGNICNKSGRISRSRRSGAHQTGSHGFSIILIAVSALLLPLIIGAYQHVQAQLLGNNNLGSPPVQSAASSPVLSPQSEPRANAYVREETAPQTLDIIKQRGYIGERYRVRSRLDGHPLVVFHIINPLADPTKLNKYPVLISHGIGGDSGQTVSRSHKTRPRKPIPGQVQFDLNGDDNTAFTLANNNFDVWLRDARGATLNDHDPDADLDPFKSIKFWNFTLDEQSQADLPSEIDFVLEQTQTDKLHYVGFSESTFMIFALMSWQPIYQNKLASVAVMAPITYIHHASGLVISVFQPSLLMPDNVGIDYLPQPLADTLGYSTSSICSHPLMAETFCKNFASLAFGYGTESDSADFQAALFRKTSLKAFKHFVQLHLQRRFGMYDYGAESNMAKYGQPVPPNYELKNVVLPRIVVFRSRVDLLSRPEDQQLLISQLGVPVYADIQLPEYSHLDFLVSKTLLRDVTMPMTKIFFQHLLDLNPNGDIFRSALMYRSPAFNPLARAPEAVSHPDGTTNALQQHSVLLHNIVRGIYGTGGSANPDRNLGLLAPKALTSPLDPIRKVAKNLLPVKAIDGYAKLLDGMMEIPGAIIHHMQ